MTTQNKLPRDDDGQLSAFAWPGGYPIFYLDSQGSTLCPKCARKMDADHDFAHWRAVAADIHWEGEPLACGECGASIESAYGPA